VAGIVMVDSARRLRPMPIPDEEIERVVGEYLDADSIRPHVARPLLREKAARRIRSSLAYAANTTDHHVVDTDIHVLTGTDTTEEFRDASGALAISLAGWAGVTRQRLHVYRGVGGHNHMIAHPHLDTNAATIRGIVEDIAAKAGLSAVRISA
jgi:thioesterase domain-containing protein